MRLDAMIKRLQEAASSGQLGEAAPVYVLIDNNELYELEIEVLPKGNLGPGSVMLKGKRV